MPAVDRSIGTAASRPPAGIRRRASSTPTAADAAAAVPSVLARLPSSTAIGACG